MKNRQIALALSIFGLMISTSAHAIGGVTVMMTTMSSQASAISAQRQASSSSMASHPRVYEEPEPQVDPEQAREQQILRVLGNKRDQAAERYESTRSSAVGRAMDLDDATYSNAECNQLKIRAYNRSFEPIGNDSVQLKMIDDIAKDAKSIGCFD